MGDPEAVIATLQPSRVGSLPVPEAEPSGHASDLTAAADAPYRNWQSPKVLTSAASASLLVTGWLIRLAGGPTGLVDACAIAAILSGAFYFGRARWSTSLSIARSVSIS